MDDLNLCKHRKSSILKNELRVCFPIARPSCRLGSRPFRSNAVAHRWTRAPARAGGSHSGFRPTGLPVGRHNPVAMRAISAPFGFLVRNHVRRLGLFSKNLLRLFLDHGPDHFDPMGSFGEHVSATLKEAVWVVSRQRVETRATQGKYHSPYAAPKNRAGAHGARLRVDVERATGEQTAREPTGCFSEQICFRVTRAIGRGNLGVLGFEEYPASIAHENRTKRTVAVLSGAMGNHYRVAQVMRISLSHGFLLPHRALSVTHCDLQPL